MKHQMKLATVTGLILAAVLSHTQAAPSPTRGQRHTVLTYLSNLRTANADKMSDIFIPNATVVSTSAGLTDALSFFHSFLPTIQNPTLTVESISQNSNGGYSARFQFHWTENGKQQGSLYLDQFIFQKGSSLLKQVVMKDLNDN